MKRTLIILVAVLAVIALGAIPVHAHGGSHGSVHGSIWIGGPVWGPSWWGYPAYPYPYPYYYPYYQSPPVVIQQQPPVYEEQAPPLEEQQSYWYYCPDSKTYYPYVKECPGGWMKVVPTPAPK